MQALDPISLERPWTRGSIDRESGRIGENLSPRHKTCHGTAPAMDLNRHGVEQMLPSRPDGVGSRAGAGRSPFR
jgi:hypothetical protein